MTQVKGKTCYSCGSIFNIAPASVIPGHKLRAIRETLNLSRPAMAELLGVPPTTLKNYELMYREAFPQSISSKMLEVGKLKDYVAYLISPTAKVSEIFTASIPTTGFRPHQ